VYGPDWAICVQKSTVTVRAIGVQLLTVRQAVACFCLIALASSVAYTN